MRLNTDIVTIPGNSFHFSNRVNYSNFKKLNNLVKLQVSVQKKLLVKLLTRRK